MTCHQNPGPVYDYFPIIHDGLRDLDTKQIGAEVFSELLNVLEENRENKIVRKSNY